MWSAQPIRPISPLKILTRELQRAVNAFVSKIASTGEAVFRNLVVTRNTKGTITGSPVGIDCGADCVGGFDQGRLVTLKASTSPGVLFSSWGGGACMGSNPICTLTMDTDKVVSANFVTSYTLTVSKTGTGKGVITSNPAGINCGTSCSKEFVQGSIINLAAAPDINSVFTGWSNGCTGIANCNVTMDKAKAVVANFALKPK